ncbi:MAG: LysR family transcriptional regulator, partial [Megasphaera micronuciformis]|nr:LysR family transcriptional regulator [Megasphaera micronuciformis]
MELKQLESFVAVIKYGSFTKAAQVLYMSQPSISTHIRALEKHLDTPLII